MKLYPFQANGVVAIRAAVAEGHRMIVVQSPTGSGKTVVASHILHTTMTRQLPSLFVAHRLELLEQTCTKLIESGVPESAIGLRAGHDKSRRRPGALVQVAGIDSLKPGDFAGYAVIIIDEAHRACCRTYLRALASRDPRAIVLGPTATPERLDGKGLRTAGFTKIVVLAQPSELVALGRIVAPSVYTVPDRLLPDLSKVAVEKGDFAQKGLEEACNRVELVGGLVEHYRQRANGTPAVAFGVSIEHSRAIAATFDAAGIPARHVDGSSGAVARRQALTDLREGRLKVASQCNLWIEGMDEPAVRTAIDARPTASPTVWFQECGRVMRVFGDEPSFVLDHAGNALRHGLPTEDRTYSLDGRAKGPPRPPANRRCPDCYIIVSNAAKTCWSCGHVFDPAEQRAVVYTPQQLRLLDPQGYRVSVWERLWLEAYADGNTPAWVQKKYLERFKGETPGAWAPPPRPPLDDSPKARRAKRQELFVIARVQGLPDAWVERRMERIFGSTLRSLMGTEAP